MTEQTEGRLANVDLHAYVDGELDAKAAEAVDAQLLEDEDLANSVAEIREMKALLQGAFEDEQAGLPDSLVTLVENDAKPKANKQWWAMCATLVLGLLGGYLFSQNINKTHEPEAWIAQIANYQTMYTQATLAPIAVSTTGKTDESKRLGDALKTTLSIPDLSSSSLEYKRGQLLASGDQPLVQLAYLNHQTGKPLALCITRKSSDPDSFKPGHLNGVNYVVWGKGDLSYIVIGDYETAELTSIAKSAAKQGITSL